MRNTLFRLILLSFLCGGAMFFCPPGGTKRILSLLCSAVLSLAVLSPLQSLDWENYSLREDEIQSTENEILQNARAGEELLWRLALQERCERYIEQRAVALGFSSLRASVGIQRGDAGDWLPYSAEIRTDRAAEAAVALRPLIDRDLGIPEERQVWLTDD